MDKNKIENIVIACDKYKGSLSAVEVCNIIEESISVLYPEIRIENCPMADGGEGTVETLVESLGGRYVELEVKGPLGEKVNARFGIIYEDTAVIEMASASGLWLLPEDKKNPEKTTTYGTGQMIKKALEMSCRKIIIGIGGSATNDAGMGMAQALGVDFLDKNGKKLGLGGENLIDIAKIEKKKSFTQRYGNTEVIIASDVDNTLYGKHGAAYVYASQKGADKDMVKRLDNGLRNFAAIVKKDMGIEIADIRGSGAAGGLGAGLITFLNGRLKPGAEIVIGLTGIEDKIRKSDLLITGEGRLDEQTLYGKSPFAVAKIAKKYNKVVVTLNGSIDETIYKEKSKKIRDLFDANFSIIRSPITMEAAKGQAGGLLRETTKEVMNAIFLLKGGKR